MSDLQYTNSDSEQVETIRQIGSLQQEIENLRLTLGQCQEANRQCQEANRTFRADLETLADALLEAADEYDLCDRYDGFVDDTNRKLSRHWLHRRQITRETTWVVTYSLTGTEQQLEEEEDGLCSYLQEYSPAECEVESSDAYQR